MTDTFSTYTPGLSTPANRAIEVTPSDTVDLAHPCRGLYVGASGDVEIITLGGDTVVLKDVFGGTILPIRVTRVKDANTTADDIVALY